LADSFTEFPQKALARILQPLVKAGSLDARQAIEVTTSWVGLPESISASEVIKAIDGPLFIISCVNVRYGYRERAGRIARQPFDEQRH
jgi:DNA-binding IscR family transcriptional regulator